MFVKHYLRHIHKCATGTDRQITKLFKASPTQYQADNLASLIVCFHTIAILLSLILILDTLFPSFHNVKIFIDKYYFETIIVETVILFFIVNKYMDKLGGEKKKAHYSWTDPLMILFYFALGAGLIILIKQTMGQP